MGVATRRVAAREARPAAQAGAILANGTVKLFPRQGLPKVDVREYGNAQIGHSGSQHDLAGLCFRADLGCDDVLRFAFMGTFNTFNKGASDSNSVASPSELVGSPPDSSMDA